MNVSGWTVDQRMRFPDWCFGNRSMVSIYMNLPAAATFYYGISEVALPDPVCLWTFGIMVYCKVYTRFRFRVGLSDTIPTMEQEMNLAVEVLPYLGAPLDGPNYIRLGTLDTRSIIVPLRKGMVTGGKKLVVSAYTGATESMMDVYFVVSELPTQMAGWMAHHKT